MRKYLGLLSIFLICFSCVKKTNEQENKEVAKDTAKAQIVGADRDSHGCITSAGYTWSVVKNDCVRIFEVGKRLDAVQENTMSAFIILDETENRAELFTMLVKSPIILERKTASQPWINGDWELTSGKGYELKKGDVLLFQSK